MFDGIELFLGLDRASRSCNRHRALLLVSWLS